MKPYFQDDGLTLYCGDSRAVLKELPDESVNCCVTSPPYFGLRDYGVDGQIGRENTPAEYVHEMVTVLREVRRTLRDDGTLWLNIGDSYASSGKNRTEVQAATAKSTLQGGLCGQLSILRQQNKVVDGLKQKDLIGIPWMLAFALRDDGWYLRSDIIWAKANCMPESVTDRPTRSHEYIFLLSKSARYYYDHEAIKELCIYDVDGTGTAARKARQKDGAKSLPTAERAGIRPAGFKDATQFDGKNGDKQRGHSRRHDGFDDHWDSMDREEQCTGMRNKRDVWTIAPANYPEAHFATFPPKLIEPCILAGCPNGGRVLDPFFGAGTTGVVCRAQHIHCTGIELNPDYCKLATGRLSQPTLQFAGAGKESA